MCNIPLPLVATVVEANEMGSSSERFDTAALVRRVLLLSFTLLCGYRRATRFLGSLFSWVVTPVLE